MREVIQGRVCEVVRGERVGDGPPMALAVARTFLDMSTGQILTINRVEQYHVPYVQVPDVEACAPILLPERIRLRIIHYYDPATWGPKGNWGDGRYIEWTKKTIRPLEMWPEVWAGISDKRQHLAIQRWREDVERRAVLDQAARTRAIIRDLSLCPKRRQHWLWPLLLLTSRLGSHGYARCASFVI
jgi:hypothetical protein